MIRILLDKPPALICAEFGAPFADSTGNRWVWRYPRTTEINEASTHKIATHRPSDDSGTAVSDASLIRRRKTASDANRFDDAGTHRFRPSAER
jgi:hypothetical protein